MHPTAARATIQLGVALGRLREEQIVGSEIHDRSETRIESVDAREVRAHDFHARNLAGMNGMGQRPRIEISDGIVGHGLVPNFRFVVTCVPSGSILRRWRVQLKNISGMCTAPRSSGHEVR